MDFGTLLHTAQNNDKTNKTQNGRYYNTKFEPPKKEQRSKQLSENIKKFLAKKEEEERLKREEAKRKKDELLALRAKDKKATKRVSIMLKRTKSANQSVIQDAIDNNNTSITLAGTSQPDEDDYGYVSQEAAAFYNKMMEKYSKIPDEPKFSFDKKKKISVKDLNNTKDRVRAALEDTNSQRKSCKRKHNLLDDDNDNNNNKNNENKFKIKTSAPPPINFKELLKIAEKKQFEPIIIESKPKDDEKLYTKKQKKELEKIKEWKDRKNGKLPPLENTKINEQINKTNNELNNNNNNNNNSYDNVDSQKKINKLNVPIKKNVEPKFDNKALINKQANLVPSNKNALLNNNNNNNNNNLKLKEPLMKSNLLNKNKILTNSVPQKLPLNNNKDDNYAKMKPNSNKDNININNNRNRIRPKINKRRIIDDYDDDEEFDSEMDDFIDDGPQDGEDYSRHIKEIFGYDKSKYRQINDDDDDDLMESSFAQQMREECISTKIGIMEDLEDMKKEEEEKRRKALMKKKKTF